MKKLLSTLFILSLLAGCEKDDNMGTVDMSFASVYNYTDVVVRIFTVENTDFPIYSKTIPAHAAYPEKNMQVRLPPGHYVIRPYAENTSSLFTAVSFQLTAGATVYASYDEHWRGHVYIR